MDDASTRGRGAGPAGGTIVRADRRSERSRVATRLRPVTVPRCAGRSRRGAPTDPDAPPAGAPGRRCDSRPPGPAGSGPGRAAGDPRCGRATLLQLFLVVAPASGRRGGEPDGVRLVTSLAHRPPAGEPPDPASARRLAAASGRPEVPPPVPWRHRPPSRRRRRRAISRRGADPEPWTRRRGATIRPGGISRHLGSLGDGDRRLDRSSKRLGRTGSVTAGRAATSTTDDKPHERATPTRPRAARADPGRRSGSHGERRR